MIFSKISTNYSQKFDISSQDQLIYIIDILMHDNI